MPQQPPPVRQPYAAPTLVVYGEAVELTQGRHTTGPRSDGGAKAKTRTD
jgi:hypothetical protein